MKKIILSLVVVAALSASCKKSYTCSCTDGTSSTVKATSTLNAENACIATNTSTKSCGI
ncbi:MAG: hypothetical protein ABI388_05365 [Bacteroidia bacterium]